MSRNLVEVIDSITKIAPDIEKNLLGVRQSAIYAAPESMYIWWNECADVLNESAGNHPRAEEIAKIFSRQEE